MKLKVPFFKQDTPYTCGPVALQMALAFFGVLEGEKQLAKEVHVDHETGTKHKWMMEVAEKKGFTVMRKMNPLLMTSVLFWSKICRLSYISLNRQKTTFTIPS